MLIRRLLPVRHKGAFIAMYVVLRIVVSVVEARLLGPPKVAWVVAGSVVILLGLRLLARSLGWYDAEVGTVPAPVAPPVAAPPTAPRAVAPPVAAPPIAARPITAPPIAPRPTAGPITTSPTIIARPRSSGTYPVHAAQFGSSRPSLARELPVWTPPANPFATATAAATPRDA